MVKDGQRDLTWVGEHTIQCTDNVFWDLCTGTSKILLTSVTPRNSIKRKKSKYDLLIPETLVK